ncbi:formyltetrahydrofolate deformylase [Rhabdothermincola salaria]|uniref:formyltetrahydrofolate deformylase n=1 Tax=Rhabdothermincola salaria TaxID=2903142 RepID=UPI001E5DEB02|nr:formyltetrahydrofolate deformylase [Rhabdothermincola salaria]
MPAEPAKRPQPSVLTVRCADQPGIVAAVANLIAEAGGNIANADQHTDRASSVFLQRIEIDGPIDWGRFDAGLADAARRMGIEWELHRPGTPTRVAVACSGELYCAADLLNRVELGELDAEVVAVVSDKTPARALAERHGVAFRSVEGGLSGEERVAQEAAFAATLEELQPDLVVLARYMRILPEAITEAWTGRMINIHHSFLPAFAGARPYHRAHDRGVKIIGATAHYVTAELDAGPIIAQRVATVTHRDEVEDLVRKGRDVERQTLADAVRLHLEQRVLVWDNRTCVFA